MMRKFLLALLLWVSFLLQTTIFKNLSFTNVAPNLLLIVTVSCAYMRGRKEGMVVGFFAGLLIVPLFEVRLDTFVNIVRPVEHFQLMCAVRTATGR